MTAAIIASDFEADLCPETYRPRIRFNFANGWSASVVFRDYCDCTSSFASVACCPTGAWGTGQTELGETEASADEVAAFLMEVSQRRAV